MLRSVLDPMRTGLVRPLAKTTVPARASCVPARGLASSSAVLSRPFNAAQAPPRTPPLTHNINVQASRNNTIVTLSDAEGHIILTRSGGQMGFKGAQRNGYEAAYRATFAIFNKIAEDGQALGIKGIGVHFKNFGQGREAFFRALITPEAAHVKARVVKLSDRTPIRVGGNRAPAPRRV